MALYAFEATTRGQVEETEFQAAARVQQKARREKPLSAWMGAAIEESTGYSHAHGLMCFWHGDAGNAIPGAALGAGTLRCPTCDGPVKTVDAESFWAEVGKVDKSVRNYEAMLRWSEGKCFLDFATLEEAWHQAITE